MSVGQFYEGCLLRPNHQRWYAKWKLSRNMHVLHTRFLHVKVPTCKLSRWLTTKISASGLRRKFVKSVLFGWECCWLSWKLEEKCGQRLPVVDTQFFFFFLAILPYPPGKRKAIITLHTDRQWGWLFLHGVWLHHTRGLRHSYAFVRHGVVAGTTTVDFRKFGDKLYGKLTSVFIVPVGRPCSLFKQQV